MANRGRPRKVIAEQPTTEETAMAKPTETLTPETPIETKKETAPIKVIRNFGEIEAMAVPPEIVKKYGKDGEKVHYFWNLRKRDAIDKFTAWGYEFALLDNPNASYRGIISDDNTDSSYVIRGENVLMFCSMETWKAKQKHDREKAKNSVKFLQRNQANKDAANGNLQEELKTEIL